MTLAEQKNNTHNGEEFIGFWGEIIKETEKAYLINIKCNEIFEGHISWTSVRNFDFWVAKSAIKDTVLHWQGKITMFLVDMWVEAKLREDFVNENGSTLKYAVLPSYYNNLNSFRK